MDIVQTLAVAAGMAWGSGIRLYGVVFAAGILSRFGYLHLPGTLAVLGDPIVLGVSGMMLLAEFVADKVPAFDSVWDAVHTFIRIPAGAVLAAMALGDYDPAIVVAAALMGGTLTASTHLAKAGTRSVINLSPEPFSNWTASLGEDAMVVGGLYAAFLHPWLFLGLLLVFLLLLGLLLPRLWRFIRRLWNRQPVASSRAAATTN